VFVAAIAERGPDVRVRQRDAGAQSRLNGAAIDADVLGSSIGGRYRFVEAGVADVRLGGKCVREAVTRAYDDILAHAVDEPWRVRLASHGSAQQLELHTAFAIGPRPFRPAVEDAGRLVAIHAVRLEPLHPERERSADHVRN